jgi:hypothetical protein
LPRRFFFAEATFFDGAGLESSASVGATRVRPAGSLRSRPSSVAFAVEGGAEL